MANTSRENIDTLQDIRAMMERSSRFISLSGWSGISAGLFALAGAWVANGRIADYYNNYSASSCASCLRDELIIIALVVFVFAFISAALFTLAKSKRDGVPIWGSASRRLLWNTLLPMVVGGLFIWRMLELKQYDLVVSSTLIFYGLALVNGSKFTMGEIRYLGYAEILTGLVSLYFVNQALLTWAFGFGVLHIIYGIAMWWRHERKSNRELTL